jgi:GntR family transcriptional regulator
MILDTMLLCYYSFGMKPVSRHSAGTLHHQVLSALTERIESGVIRVGDRLPSEADLVRDYGVSRTTARRALDELRRQGMVRREPGRGTFLASPRLRSDLTYLYSFSEELERLGYRPEARLILQKEIVADEEVAEQLGVAPGEKVLYVRRLRLADGQPIFVGDSHLPVTRFPELREADYASVSLKGLMESCTDRSVVRARQWIGAAALPADVAGLLELEPGAPTLKIERVAFLEGDEPVESVVAFFHPDRYQHYNELSSRADGPAG